MGEGRACAVTHCAALPRPHVFNAMNTATRDTPQFIIKDCALIQIATGVRARNVRELRDRLLDVGFARGDADRLELG